MQFISPTFGILNLSQVVEKINNFITTQNGIKYNLIVGTDSHVYKKSSIIYVSAIILHNVGKGGIYFYKKRVDKGNIKQRKNIAHRMFIEATLSLDLAGQLIDELIKQDGAITYTTSDIEIHIDVGRNGKSRDYIDAISGMVTGMGYRVKTKPEAFGASCVADKHSKK